MNHLEETMKLKETRRNTRTASGQPPTLMEIGDLFMALKSDMQRDLDKLKFDITSIQTENMQIRSDVLTNATSLQTQNNQITQLTKKVERLEKEEKKATIIVRGIPRGQRRPHEKRNAYVMNIIRANLKLPNVKINEIQDFGKPNHETETVLIKLQNTDDKYNILKIAKFLKNTNLSISEWLSREIATKSHLLKERRFAIDEGKNACLKGKKKKLW